MVKYIHFMSRFLIPELEQCCAVLRLPRLPYGRRRLLQKTV